MINNKQLLEFIQNLKKEYKIIAPIKDEEKGEIMISQIDQPEQIDWSGKVPLYSFKKYFIKADEDLVVYGEKISSTPEKEKPVAIIGMNVLDLRALGMCDLIFKRDVYYQEKRLNSLIIGASNVLDDSSDYETFTEKFEENFLEHLNFDIFLEIQADKVRIFTGSRLGQEVLSKYGITDYEHIQFAGFIREEGKDKRMLQLYEKVKNSADSPVWEELGKRCYACGKCTLVCPTCYCFDFQDVVGLEGSKKVRKWGSCFYPEFSQIAGDHKFLDSISKRIFYWYYHKFVAIPEKYSVPGCVSCLRCVKTCPAGIDIREVLDSL